MVETMKKTELIALKSKIDLDRFETLKMSVEKHNEFRDDICKHNAYICNKIEDVFNRLVETEIYLDKYLPYNTFV